MTRKKVVRASGRTVWAYDNAHDVVMAHLVEEGLAQGLPETVLSQWRNASTVRNLGFDYNEAELAPEELSKMLRNVRERVIRSGDVEPDDLSKWSVLGACAVSGGFLRGGKLPVKSLVDVVDGLRAMVNGTLSPDPPNAQWFFGQRGGRSTVPLAS